MRKDYIAPTADVVCRLLSAPLCDGSITNVTTTEQEGDYEDNTINAKYIEIDDWQPWDVWDTTLDESWQPYFKR